MTATATAVADVADADDDNRGMEDDKLMVRRQ